MERTGSRGGCGCCSLPCLSQPTCWGDFMGFRHPNAPGSKFGRNTAVSLAVALSALERGFKHQFYSSG